MKHKEIFLLCEGQRNLALIKNKNTSLELLVDKKLNSIIKVADAAIYPKNGEVNIYKRAEMETFKSAMLLANVETKYHVMYDVTANIYSRKIYNAKGKYDYVTETGDKEILNFDTVYVLPSNTALISQSLFTNNRSSYVSIN